MRGGHVKILMTTVSTPQQIELASPRHEPFQMLATDSCKDENVNTSGHANHRSVDHTPFSGQKRRASVEEEGASRLSAVPDVGLAQLADGIQTALEDRIPDDEVGRCDSACLSIIAVRPDEVLDLAHQKLHTWPYRDVPACWRRLYEDASLYKATKLIRAYATNNQATLRIGKRLMLDSSDGGSHLATTGETDWVSEVVYVLDMGIALSGAPSRKDLFEAVFQHLGGLVTESIPAGLPKPLPTPAPKPLETDRGIPSCSALSFEAFQRHLDTSTMPLLITGALHHWPANDLWNQPAYLLRLTLGGRRLVPVEVGRSYTDELWGQRIVPFAEFMSKYLVPENPEKVGYLAQHDLFSQVPALREDIRVPDYCYTTPPSSDLPASRSGFPGVPQLDEPLLNAWLGPNGTKSPLHTDPYHNILCQVVGYKYVRLYAPEETPNLYPRGVDDAGVNMENTSYVDVAELRATNLGHSHNGVGTEHKYPLAVKAVYQETILGPGECLYIPVGWWHYIESLTVSFSVSFWWN